MKKIGNLFDVRRMGAVMGTLLLGVGLASCETEKPCNPSNEIEGGDTTKGVEVVLEMEDENGNVRAVTGDSDYSFGVYGKNDATVQVDGTGFRKVIGNSNDVNVNLTFFAKENVVFQGWSWRYAEDAKKTYRGVDGKEGRYFENTIAIQANPELTKLDIPSYKTSFTCEYDPDKSNKVYVRVKYGQVSNLSHPKYVFDVFPISLDRSYLPPSSYELASANYYRLPKLFEIKSLKVYRDIKGGNVVIPLPIRTEAKTSIGGFHSIEPEEGRDHGRYISMFLQDSNNPNETDLVIPVTFEQLDKDPTVKGSSYLPVSTKNFSLPIKGVKDLNEQITNFNPSRLVAVRTSNYAFTVLKLRETYAFSPRGDRYDDSQLKVRFYYSNGKTGEVVYKIAKWDKKRDRYAIVESIDLLHDIVYKRGVSIGDLTVGLNEIRFVSEGSYIGNKVNFNGAQQGSHFDFGGIKVDPK